MIEMYVIRCINGTRDRTGMLAVTSEFEGMKFDLRIVPPDALTKAPDKAAQHMCAWYAKSIPNQLVARIEKLVMTTDDLEEYKKSLEFRVEKVMLTPQQVAVATANTKAAAATWVFL